MSDKKFSIVTYSQLVDGFSRDDVANNLAQLCKFGPDKLARVFSGKRFVFKSGVDGESARRYFVALNKAGIICKAEQPRPAKVETAGIEMASSAPVAMNRPTGVTCPKCGTEQAAGATCINCQVVMEKYRQRAEEQAHAAYASPASEESGTKRGIPVFAIVLVLVMIGGASAFFFSSDSSAGLQKITTSLKLIGKSDADLRQELYYKEANLGSLEKMIDDIGKQHENLVKNAPICPTTGRRATIKMTKDPRGELREQCKVLREEIRVLKEQLGKT